MKKKLFMLCIIPLILSACDISKKNSSSDYQADLKYGETLSDANKTIILREARTKAADLTHAEQKLETSYDTALNKRKETVATTYDMYDNSLKTHTKTTAHVIANDIEYDIAPIETTRNVWKHSIVDITRYISYDIDDSDQPSNISLISSSTNLVANSLFASLFLYDTSYYLAFRANGGYELVYSNHSRNVEYAEVGGQTKEKITETKTQQILHFNLFYQFEWSSFVNAIVYSVDPTTNEWYDSPKEVSKTSMSVDAVYGQKQTRDEKELFETFKNQQIVWGIEPLIRTAEYKTTMNDSDFVTDSSVEETSFVSNNLNTVLQQYSLVLDNRSSVTTKRNALFGKAASIVYYFDGKEDTVKTFNTSFTLSYNYNYYLSTGSTQNGNGFYYFTDAKKLTFTFYISLTNDNISVDTSYNY